jgi:inosine-uridine nucleoside N-ribohydrolase
MRNVRNSGIPTILDTDIGSDIDDTWALAMLLNSPELDLKMVLSATGDTLHRAKISAKLLETAGRTDVAVGIGVETPQGPEFKRQAAWVDNYDLYQYPGKVYGDGVGAMISMIMSADEPVTILCIAPATNIAEALKREPGIAGRCRFVGMHGSIRRGYNNSETTAAEYNVKADIPAAKAAFGADWSEAVITPLDTCGLVVLKDELYRRVTASQTPLIRALLENYKIWAYGEEKDRSSVLFDTVAVHLAYSTGYLKMEEMNVKVTDDGFTVIDPAGKRFNCAIEWTDMEAFERDLVARLLA